MTDTECVELLRWALPRLEMRWPGFRKVRKQVCKRLRRRMRELDLTLTEEYRRYLEANPEEWEQLDDCCRITISRFFRDQGVWEHLRQHVLPELARASLANAGHLRCWSAGCASGEEPYSLAMVWRMAMRDRFPSVSFEVLGTDADATVLNRARRAIYGRSSLRDLPSSWIDIAFESTDSELRLGNAFRVGVKFKEQDLRDEAPEGPFDLIMCRNLAFTYFALPLQRRILDTLLDRLAEGGRIVLGSHEELPAGSWPLVQEGPNLPVFAKLGSPPGSGAEDLATEPSPQATDES